eukprot:3269702-Alexandrium_andersonii.AAC.1
MLPFALRLCSNKLLVAKTRTCTTGSRDSSSATTSARALRQWPQARLFHQDLRASVRGLLAAGSGVCWKDTSSPPGCLKHGQ